MTNRNQFLSQHALPLATASNKKITLLIATVLTAALLSGCQSYTPLALDPNPRAPSNLQQVPIDTSKVDVPTLRGHPFDPSNGLDMTEVATLAVVQNPELKLARHDLKIANAQAFAAGLLPDPQFNATGDYPKDSSAGLTPAYNRGISFDLASLLTHPALERSAKAAAQRTELTNLWQEWQVVAQARQLYIRTIFIEQTREVLQAAFAAQNDRLLRAEKSIEQGNLTRDAVAPFLTAREDIRKQLSDLLRLQEQVRHDLNALLGLAPSAHLDLIDSIALPEQQPEAIQDALERISSRRPDLLALKAGYESQDQKYRAAILAQFQTITLGVNQARDTGANLTLGYSAAISLPLFNRNRGNIAVESATRQRLHDEYGIRILQAQAEVDRLISDRRLARVQLQEAERTIPLLRETVRSAEAAMSAGRLTLFNYVDLQNSLLTKEVEMINLRQVVLEQEVALMSLLGSDEFQSRDAMHAEAK